MTLTIHQTPIVQGSSVRLEPMSRERATPQYLAWLQDPIVSQYIHVPLLSLAELEKYVIEKISDPAVRFWAILDQKSGQHIGNVKLEPVSKELSRATFGILIGNREFWGRGVATEVTLLVSDFAFSELGVAKVDLGVQDDNIGAVKAYKKAGFHIEARFRKHQFFKGALRDVTYMAKFADGFVPGPTWFS